MAHTTNIGKKATKRGRKERRRKRRRKRKAGTLLKRTSFNLMPSLSKEKTLNQT